MVNWRKYRLLAHTVHSFRAFIAKKLYMILENLFCFSQTWLSHFLKEWDIQISHFKEPKILDLTIRDANGILQVSLHSKNIRALDHLWKAWKRRGQKHALQLPAKHTLRHYTNTEASQWRNHDVLQQLLSHILSPLPIPLPTLWGNKRGKEWNLFLWPHTWEEAFPRDYSK